VRPRSHGSASAFHYFMVHPSMKSMLRKGEVMCYFAQ